VKFKTNKRGGATFIGQKPYSSPAIESRFQKK
jgi:hypothetical protein